MLAPWRFFVPNYTLNARCARKLFGDEIEERSHLELGGGVAVGCKKDNRTQEDDRP